ncbi:hypothetical protein N7449_001752 [Penicillium cf. viridicatum]|uniref:Uncharacterized protein n=1 Tax=Penicillium cf. viridicatum TaxID=2972119 RepID=A0A9W9N8U1_9EURO|nr:hypothetical protein N7449_001752 [Penicillium cf. viridicatum]
MWNKVFGSDSAIWRDRFGKHYDIVPGRTSMELKIEYQIRALVLRSSIQFKEKEDERQYLWMEVMQTMLKEALTLFIAPGDTSKTLQRIHEALERVNFLSEFQNHQTPSPLFCALQLCLSSFALDSDLTQPCRRTDYNLREVYSYGDKVGEPFINHENLDLARLLDIRHFWQRHVLHPVELSFQESFSELPEDMKPKVRKEIPSEASKLSPSWLGYYSCIHPVSDLLKNTDRQTCADLEIHGEVIDPMTLDLKPSEHFWPKQCSKIIPLAGGPDTKRTYFEGKQRAYNGPDEAGNPVFGFTEEIAAPHGGFGGWTRICFIIAEGDEDDEDDEDDEEDEEKTPSLLMEGAGWIHGYEAVIIPGGRMMLGRWLDMKATYAKGPFIFWDV